LHIVSAVKAEGLACVRGGRSVFAGLNLAVAAQSLLVVEGPNGSGKTSLLRILAGLIPAAAGEVVFTTAAGQINDPEERGRLVGWLGHLDAAKPQLTPAEVLAFFARLYRAPSSPSGLLREIGLERSATIPCVHLSTGQRKRLALARLKMSGRPVWLLDEPLASLDEHGKSLVLRFLREHCAAGGVAIIASHEPLGLEASLLRLQ